jgi:hypothetical protein
MANLQATNRIGERLFGCERRQNWMLDAAILEGFGSRSADCNNFSLGQTLSVYEGIYA